MEACVHCLEGHSKSSEHQRQNNDQSVLLVIRKGRVERSNCHESKQPGASLK